MNQLFCLLLVVIISLFICVNSSNVDVSADEDDLLAVETSQSETRLDSSDDTYHYYSGEVILPKTSKKSKKSHPSHRPTNGRQPIHYARHYLPEDDFALDPSSDATYVQQEKEPQRKEKGKPSKKANNERKKGMKILSSLMDLSTYFPFPFIEDDLPLYPQKVPVPVKKSKKQKKVKQNPYEQEKIEQQKIEQTSDGNGNNFKDTKQVKRKRKKSGKKTSLSSLYAPIDWSSSISLLPSDAHNPFLFGIEDQQHSPLLLPDHGLTLPPPLPSPPAEIAYNGYTHAYPIYTEPHQTAVSPYPIPPAPTGPPSHHSSFQYPAPQFIPSHVPAPSQHYPILLPNPVGKTLKGGKVTRFKTSQLTHLPEKDYKTFDPLPRASGSKVRDRFFSANIVQDLGIPAPLQLLKVKHPNGAVVCLGNHLSFVDTMFEPSLNWNPVYVGNPSKIPPKIIAKPAHLVQAYHPNAIARRQKTSIDDDESLFPDPRNLFNNVWRRTSNFLTQQFSNLGHLWPRRSDDYEDEESSEEKVDAENVNESDNLEEDTSTTQAIENRADIPTETTTPASEIEREDGPIAGGQEESGDSDREPVTSPTTQVVSPPSNYSQAIDQSDDIEKRDFTSDASPNPVQEPPKRREQIVAPHKPYHQPLYTAVMLDPDLSLIFGQFVHILRVNIESPGKSGIPLTPYIQPLAFLPAISSPASPFHRYVLLVFAQTHPIDPGHAKEYLAKKYVNFKISEFGRQFGLQKTPIAGNFYYGRLYVKTKVIC